MIEDKNRTASSLHLADVDRVYTPREIPSLPSRLALEGELWTRGDVTEAVPRRRRRVQTARHWKIAKGGGRGEASVPRQDEAAKIGDSGSRGGLDPSW